MLSTTRQQQLHVLCQDGSQHTAGSDCTAHRSCHFLFLSLQRLMPTANNSFYISDGWDDIHWLLFVGNYFGHFRAIWLFLRLSRENEIADAQTDGGMLKILAISSQLCNLVKFVYYDWPLTNREHSSSSSSLCSTNAEIMIVLILDTTGNNSCRSLVSTAISSSCYGQPGSERWEGTSQPAHQQKQQLHSLLKSFDRCARAHTHTTVLRPQSRFTRVCRSKDSEETS